MDEIIPTIPPVPPVPPTLPPVGKSQNWLKILLAGIGVLIVLGLFGNLYLLARNQKPAAEVTPTTTQPAQIAATPTQTAPLSTPTPDLTANWKTYTDENTHVQFKYPLSWYAQKYADSTLNVFLENKPFEIIKGTEFMTSIQIGLNEWQNTVTGQKFYVEKTLKEGVERFRELFDPKTIQITELTIDGKKATKLSGLLGPGMLEGEYFVNTLIQLDDKLLVATLTKKSYEDVYNQILSTFKFLP